MPTGMNVIPITSADDMLKAVQTASPDADALIMAAAVADYAPTELSSEKLKKSEGPLAIDLERTVDILDAVRDVPVRIGFAAESQDVLENAAQKLDAKGLDLIVANDISRSDIGFASDHNECVLIDRSGSVESLPLLSKRAVADRILDRLAEQMNRASEK